MICETIFSRQKPFPVIFKNDRVDVGNVLLDRCHDLPKLLRRWPVNVFAIDTDNLLVTRDYPAFSRLSGNDSSSTALEISIFCLSQQFPELLATAIFYRAIRWSAT